MKITDGFQVILSVLCELCGKTRFFCKDSESNRFIWDGLSRSNARRLLKDFGIHNVFPL